MVSGDRNAPDGGTPTSLREHCEKILKELQRQYAHNPKETLRRSIEDVQALIAKLAQPAQPPRDGGEA